MILAINRNTPVVEVPNGPICNPVGKVLKRLANGRENYLLCFYQVFASRESESDGTISKSRKWWQFWKG
jgi:hypothetical protein